MSPGAGGQLCHDVDMPVIRQVSERQLNSGAHHELNAEPTRGIEVQMLGPHIMDTSLRAPMR